MDQEHPLAVLKGMLDDLTARPFVIEVTEKRTPGSDRDDAERIAAIFNRKGGPKLLPHVIDG